MSTRPRAPLIETPAMKDGGLTHSNASKRYKGGEKAPREEVLGSVLTQQHPGYSWPLKLPGGRRSRARTRTGERGALLGSAQAPARGLTSFEGGSRQASCSSSAAVRSGAPLSYQPGGCGPAPLRWWACQAIQGRGPGEAGRQKARWRSAPSGAGLPSRGDAAFRKQGRPFPPRDDEAANGGPALRRADQPGERSFTEDGG